MKSKPHVWRILVLAIIGIVLVSGCIQQELKECEGIDDCLDKICFTKDCVDYECSYSQISPCCGNGICETGETYETCAEDCVKSGVLNKDEVWGGIIHVTGDIDVIEGVTLTILPGTIRY